MTIFHDVPRRYKPKGRRWVHIFSGDVDSLRAFGKRHGLTRWDTSPFPHWDVDEKELAAILKTGEDITPMDARQTALYVRQFTQIKVVYE